MKNLIFSFLIEGKDYKSLARATAVCREWKDLAGTPMLWRGYDLRISSKDIEEDIVKMLAVSRYTSIILEDDFNDIEQLKPVLANLATGQAKHITSLELYRQDVSCFRKQDKLKMVARALAGLVRIRLDETSLDIMQVEAICMEIDNRISEGTCRLEELFFSTGTNLSYLKPRQLAKIAGILRKLDFSCTFLTSGQIEAILHSILRSNNVEVLKLAFNAMCDVRILSKVIWRQEFSSQVFA